MEKCGQNACKLDFSIGVHIYAIFHVSWLRMNVGDSTKVVNDLPMMDEEGRMTIQPKKVLEYRHVRK